MVSFAFLLVEFRLLLRCTNNPMNKGLLMMLKLLIFAAVCSLVIVAQEKSVSIALFVQVGNANKIIELMQCVGNVVRAKELIENQNEKFLLSQHSYPRALKIDVYATYIGTDNTTIPKMIDDNLSNFGNNIANKYVQSASGRGFDVGQYLLQLSKAEEMKKNYDFMLKIHSKSNRVWANHASQCLCGTPSHVLSILEAFFSRPLVHLIAPVGLTFSSVSNKSSLHPILLDMYFQNHPLSAAFGSTNVENMKSNYQTIFGSSLDVPVKNYVCVAGTMFWARYSALRVKALAAALPKLADKWSQAHVSNNGIEHSLERLIPTWIMKNGGTLGEMLPAPKVLPMYFPQYHRIKENDRFHGDGFTEWTLLKPHKDYHMLMKPLAENEGGLGYYDLTELKTRKRQAELARLGGVSGFVYYHYWFSGEKAPENHLVMEKIPEMRLLDGEPNLPFMFSWANEPWTRTWSGETDQVLLSQEYGDRDDWIKHFQYLLKFFKHENYIKVNGKPAFAIYRIGHMGTKLKPILNLWNTMAKQNGFPGIHFINTIGNFLTRDPNTFEIWKNTKEIEACFHFRPQLRDPFPAELPSATLTDLHIPQVPTMQYWGAYTNFDPRPRRPTAFPARGDTTPAFFERSLLKSFAAMYAHAPRFHAQNLFFVTAWNEWNEQAVLEPDNKNGFGYLLGLKNSLEHIPIQVFKG